MNLKQRNKKCTLFFKAFLKNWQIIGHKKKTQNDNCVCVCQKSLETTIFIGYKQLGPDNNT